MGEKIVFTLGLFLWHHVIGIICISKGREGMQQVQRWRRLLLADSHQVQINTPENSNGTTKDSAVLERNQGEADDGDKRPKLLASEQEWEEVLCGSQYNSAKRK